MSIKLHINIGTSLSTNSIIGCNISCKTKRTKGLAIKIQFQRGSLFFYFILSLSNKRREGGKRRKERNHKPLRFSPYAAEWFRCTGRLGRSSWNYEADLIRSASLSLATLFYTRKNTRSASLYSPRDIGMEKRERRIVLLYISSYTYFTS